MLHYKQDVNLQAWGLSKLSGLQIYYKDQQFREQMIKSGMDCKLINAVKQAATTTMTRPIDPDIAAYGSDVLGGLFTLEQESNEINKNNGQNALAASRNFFESALDFVLKILNEQYALPLNQRNDMVLYKAFRTLHSDLGPGWYSDISNRKIGNRLAKELIGLIKEQFPLFMERYPDVNHPVRNKGDRLYNCL